MSIKVFIINFIIEAILQCFKIVNFTCSVLINVYNECTTSFIMFLLKVHFTEKYYSVLKSSSVLHILTSNRTGIKYLKIKSVLK